MKFLNGLGKFFALIFSTIYYFLLLIMLFLMFSSKFITKEFYVKTIKKIDLSEIKIKEENNKTIEQLLIEKLEESGIDEKTSKEILKNEKLKEFVGNIIGNSISSIITKEKLIEVTNEDLKKIINEIPIDIKISDEELNELTNEINTAIKENIEYKEEINLDEKVISIIKFIQSKYMYIFIMCFIIINYLLISLLTWSFHKPLRYLSIPTMLTGITLIVTIFLPSLLINILNVNLPFNLEPIIKVLLNPLLIPGILLTIIGVVMIVLYNIINKKEEQLNLSIKSRH